MTNAATNNFIKSLTQEVSWIGALKDPNGDWSWTDGSDWDFTSWGSGQPNNWRGYQDKVTINYGGAGMWDDAAGETKNPFICKKQLEEYLFENCGLIPDTPTINAGREVAANSYPWHVGLFDDECELETFFCGGSIITPSHILTAAHCMFKEGKIIVWRYFFLNFI